MKFPTVLKEEKSTHIRVAITDRDRVKEIAELHGLHIHQVITYLIQHADKVFPSDGEAA